MMAVPATPEAMRMGWFDKFLLLAALSIAVALFLTIGWMAIAPEDPRGPVSLLTHRHALAMVLQAGLLSAVTAAIATVMIGVKLPDVGAFAAALGLAFVSLQGQTAAYLLMDAAGDGNAGARALSGKLAIEALAWFAVILVAVFTSGLVTRWCAGLVRGSSQGTAAGHACSGADAVNLAASECPLLCHVVARGVGVERVQRWNGVRTTAIMTVAGILLYGILVSGSRPHMVRHGQTCFAVFTAFYVGGWIARRTYPARTAFWGLIAVPLACVLGHAWTMLAGVPAGRYAHLASIPGSDFLRALPITFIAVGTLGVLTTHWTIEPAAPAERSSKQSSAPARSRKRNGT